MPYYPGYDNMTPMRYSSGTMVPEDRVIGVPSIDDVKAYPMPPSSRFPFFSTVDDVCWIKTTDSNCAYTIMTFDMTRREDPSEYVSREEYNELKDLLLEVLNGKQSVPKQQEQLVGEQRQESGGWEPARSVRPDV